MNFRYPENLMAAREANDSPRYQIASTCEFGPRGYEWPVMVQVGIGLHLQDALTRDKFNGHRYRPRRKLAC